MASAAVWKALLVVHGGSPRSQWAKTVEEIARKHPQGKLCILFKASRCSDRAETSTVRSLNLLFALFSRVLAPAQDATSPVTPSTLRLVTRSYQAISTVVRVPLTNAASGSGLSTAWPHPSLLLSTTTLPVQAPRMDLVPLFPAAGWTLVGASKIQDLTAIAIDATAAGSSSDADVSAIESVRAAAGLPILAKLKVGTSAVSAGDGERR